MHLHAVGGRLGGHVVLLGVLGREASRAARELAARTPEVASPGGLGSPAGDRPITSCRDRKSSAFCGRLRRVAETRPTSEKSCCDDSSRDSSRQTEFCETGRFVARFFETGNR